MYGPVAPGWAWICPSSLRRQTDHAALLFPFLRFMLIPPLHHKLMCSSPRVVAFWKGDERVSSWILVLFRSFRMHN
jgi:hypothetical protein